MPANSRYFTSILKSFSTFVENLKVDEEAKLQTKQLLLDYLAWKKKFSVWSLAELEQFIAKKKIFKKYDKPICRLVHQFVERHPPHQREVFLLEFLLALKSGNCSKSTIKNYKSDISQFLDFSKPLHFKQIFKKPVLDNFYRFQKQKGLKANSVTRKFSSIIQFALWLKQTGILELPPKWLTPGYIYQAPGSKGGSKACGEGSKIGGGIWRRKAAVIAPAKQTKPAMSDAIALASIMPAEQKKQKTSVDQSGLLQKLASSLDFSAKIAKQLAGQGKKNQGGTRGKGGKNSMGGGGQGGATNIHLPKIPFSKNKTKDNARQNQEQRAKLKAKLHKLSSKIQEKVAQFTPRFALPYINLIMIVLFFLGMGVFGYRQFFTEAPIKLAYPSTPTRPDRILSFQGRLTDAAQNPITGSTAMQFILYDDLTAGSNLWSGSCNVDPDQDGIFAVGLGSDCGTEIDESVFTENSNIWLEVKVGSAPQETLTPRQPIRTVAYALNAETLQGYPIEASGAATFNTVVTMNEYGEVVLAETGPKLKSSDGSLSIEAATQLNLTTASGSNGDIVLDADGIGGVISKDYLSAPGATLSATYAGGTALVVKGGPSGTANIMEWQNSGGSVLSNINSSGQLDISQINALNSNGLKLYDDGGNGIFVEDGGNVGVGTDSPSAKLEVFNTGSATSIITRTGDNDWSEIGAYSGASDTTKLQLFAGNTDANPIKIGSRTNTQVAFTVFDSPKMVMATNGNVGIGTTTPLAQLHIQTSGSAVKGLIVKGSASQTANIAEYQNSSGDILGAVQSWGGAYFNKGESDTNLFLGRYAGQDNNVSGVGIEGKHNTFVGRSSGVNNTTGYNNNAMGYASLYSNTTGYYNNVMGTDSLRSNTTGSHNNAMGMYSLFFNTTGNQNNAMGYASLRGNTTGYNNNAMGYASLYSLRPTSKAITAFADAGGGQVTVTSAAHGQSNGTTVRISGTTNYNGSFAIANATADTFEITDTWVANDATGWWGIYSEGRYATGVGAYAGYDITTGSNNTLLGYNTGRGITTGSSNTILGAQVTGLAAGLSNNIILADGDGNVRIQVDDTGNVGIGTTTPSEALHVEGGVRLGSTSNTNNVLDTAAQAGAASGNLYWGNAQLVDSNNIGDFGVSSITNSDGTLTISPTTGNAIASINLANVNTWTGLQTFNSLAIADTDVALTGASTNFTATGDISFNTDDLYIDKSSGNVGVGTTVPGAKLDVYESASRYSYLRGGSIFIQSDYGTEPILKITGTGAADLVNIFDGGTEVFTILDGGNVGIGTTTPTQDKLVVAGAIYATTQADHVNEAVLGGRTLTAGSGLTGTGNLTADRTFNVGAGDGIDVATDSVAVDVTDILGIGLTESSNNIDIDQTYNFAWTGTHSYSAADMNFTNATSFTLDVTGDLILDADGGDIYLADGGTTFGTFTNSSSNLRIAAGVDQGMIFSSDTGFDFYLDDDDDDASSEAFNIYDGDGSSIFEVSESQITSSIPHQFTSAGDVSMAYDLIFTNQTASKIESYGPLTIEAGESFESNDLTLTTYNAGDIVLDAGDNSGDSGTIKFYDSYIKAATDTTPIAFSNAAADINTFRSNFSDETIVDAINETYTAATGGGGGIWTDGGTYIYPSEAGNYGSTGLQITDVGNISMNGSLVVDGNATVSTDMGIGTAVNSAYDLSVGSHIRSVSGNIYTGGGQGFVFGSSTGEGEYIYRSGNDIKILAGGSDVLTVDGDGGNVGVGTTVPNQKLSINGGIGFANQNDTDKKLYSPSDGTLQWMTHNAAGTHAFEISHQGTTVYTHLDTTGDSYIAASGGNVGVGTTVPGAKLEIQGTLETNDRLTITDAQDSGGNLKFSAANPYIHASSYFIAPGGAFFNSGTVYTTAELKARGGIADDAGNLVLNDTVDIGSATTGLRISTTGGISDIDGTTIVIDDDLTVNNDIYSVGGISTYDTSPSDNTVEAGQFCLGNGTNCITSWGTTGSGRKQIEINRTIGGTTGNTVAIGHFSNDGFGKNIKIHLKAHTSSTIDVLTFEINDHAYSGTATDWLEIPLANGISYTGTRRLTVDVYRQDIASTSDPLYIRIRNKNGAGAGNVQAYIDYDDDSTLTELTSQSTTATAFNASTAPAGGAVTGIKGNVEWDFPVSNGNAWSTGTYGMFIKNNGKVGIGTTVPGEGLTIGTGTSENASTTNDLYVTGDIELDGSDIWFANNDKIHYDDTNNDFEFGADGSSGNAGITAGAGVFSSIYTSGNVDVDGTLYFDAANADGNIDMDGFDIVDGNDITLTGTDPSLYIWASDSGDSDFFIGEDSAGGYGMRIYWDASYTYYMKSRYAGTDTNVFYVDTRNADLVMAQPIARGGHSVGFLQGSYNNIGNNDAKSNPIYTIGSSYNPTDDALSNMYGIGYAYTNASFITDPGPNSWGMYVAADGDARVFLAASDGGSSYFNTGSVGIGTTSPDHKLQVNGTIAPEATNQDLGTTGLRWDLLANTINADNTVTLTGLGTGTDNTVIILNGSNQLTTDEIDSRVWGSSLIDGSGTTNYVARWSDSNTLTTGVLYDNGTNVGVGTTNPGAKLWVTGGGAEFSSSLSINEDATTNQYGSRALTASLCTSTSGWTVWTGGTGCGVATDSTYSFEGQTTTVKATKGDSTCFVDPNPSPAVAISTTYSTTFIMRNSAGTQPSGITFTFDNETCAPSWSAYGNGWYRGTCTKTTDATSSNSWDGFYTTGDDVWIARAQIEQKSAATAFTAYKRTSPSVNASAPLEVNTTSNSYFYGGNVGIGTTAPSYKLQVAGTVKLGSNSNVIIDSDDWDISAAAVGTGFTQWNVDNLRLDGNTLSVTNDSGLYLYDNASNGIFIKDGGNVGIGTTNPLQKLQVAGNIVLQAGGYLDDDTTMGEINDDWMRFNGYIEFRSNIDDYGIVLRDKDTSSYLGITQVGGASYLTDSNTYSNYFIKGDGADATVRGDLTVSGDKITFGHGSTINNETDTDLNITGDNDIFLRGSGTGSYLNIATPTGGASNFAFFHGATDDIYMSYGTSGTVHWRAAGTERMALTSAGNLQMDGNLTVSGTGQSIFSGYVTVSNEIQLGDGSVTDPSYTFTSDGNTGMYRGGTDILRFTTAGADRLTILANGNVGIGDTTPTEGKLTVAGTGYFTGLLRSTADLAIGNTSGTGYLNVYGDYDGQWFSSEIDLHGDSSGTGKRWRVGHTGSLYVPCGHANALYFSFWNPTQVDRMSIQPGNEADIDGDGTFHSNGMDYAEYVFPKTNTDPKKYFPGMLIARSEEKYITYTKAKKNKYQNLLGIVSTNPSFKGSIWDAISDDQSDKSILVGLIGQVPAIVFQTTESIDDEDYIVPSHIPGVGTKTNKAGPTVGKALESTDHWNEAVCPIVSSINDINWPEDDGSNPSKPCFRVPVSSLENKEVIKSEYNLTDSDHIYVGKIMVFVNVSWYDPDIYLDSTGNISLSNGQDPQKIASSSSELNLATLENLDYQTTDSSTNQVINRLANFSEAAIAQLKVGLTKTSSLIADNAILTKTKIADLTADIFQATSASISQLVTSTLSATQATITNLTAQRISLDPSATSLEFTDSNGNIIAELDQDGSLEISGDFTTNSLTANDLTASNLHSQQLNTNSLQAIDASISGTTQLAQLEVSGTTKLADLTANGQTQLAQLTAESAQINNAAINNATISGTLTATNLTAKSSRLEQLEAKVAQLEHIQAQTAQILGDATVSGQLTIHGDAYFGSNSTISGDATISGTLKVATLDANNIVGFKEKVANAFEQPSLLASLIGDVESADTQDLIEIVNSAGYEASSSSSIQQNLAQLNLDVDDVVITPAAAYLERYFEVNGSAYIADALGVGNYILLGDGLRLGQNSLEVIASASNPSPTLHLQPSGQGSISLMAGLIILDDSGNVGINGNVQIAGTLETKTLISELMETNLIKPANFDEPLQIQIAGAATESGTIKRTTMQIINEQGIPVATISAQGRAEFAGGLGMDSEDLTASPSANLIATKTTGKAKIEAGETSITINSTLITEKSQIYVTPLSSTNNQVLYVKTQTPDDPDTPEIEGSVIIGFDLVSVLDVEFNWWIIN